MTIKNNCYFVSVIVPVFNDAQRLKVCLEALETQSYPQGYYEVIVIDNGSDPNQNIKGIVSQFTQTIYTYESIPGSYTARNKGLSVAKGEIIAFTDSDCIPRQNWLEKGVDSLVEAKNCGLVVGKIDVFFQDPNNPTAVELYESVTAFPQEQLLMQYHGAANANIFTFKKVFDQVGLFDDNLKSIGDLDWGERVYQNGYSQIYQPEALIYHPARTSWQELYWRTISLAIGTFEWQRKKTFSRSQKLWLSLINLVKNFVPPLMFVFTTLRNPELTSFNAKIKVCLVMFFVRYVTALEMIKLQFRGIPSRAHGWPENE